MQGKGGSRYLIGILPLVPLLLSLLTSLGAVAPAALPLLLLAQFLRQGPNLLLLLLLLELGVLPLPLDSTQLIFLLLFLWLLLGDVLLPCHDGSVLDLLERERTSLIFLAHVEKLGNDIHACTKEV